MTSPTYKAGLLFLYNKDRKSTPQKICGIGNNNITQIFSKNFITQYEKIRSSLKIYTHLEI